MTDMDAITFELLRNGLETIADEMTVTLVRTAHSGNIRDGMDFSTALCDDRGALIAQGTSIALHVGSVPDAIAAVQARFGDDIAPGDVIVLNDPYCGGMHLPDFFFFKPVFSEGRLLCWLVVVADQADVGGIVPGGRPVDAKEIFQEGLRLPPVKAFDQGRRVDAVWEIVRQNVRIPQIVLGDMNACLGACAAGEALVRRTLREFGDPLTRAYFVASLEHSERLTRARVAELPDGVYEFRDYLDDSVTGTEPVPIHARITIAGDQLSVSFAGTGAQVPSSINCTFSFTKSAVYAAVRTLMDPELPTNEGFFAAITVEAPIASVVYAQEPAAVASRGVTGSRVVDTVLGALAQIDPRLVPAAGEGGMSSVRLTGPPPGSADASLPRFVMWDSVAGTWGARSGSDGVDGCSNFAVNGTNVPVEIIEAEYPVRIVRYGLQPDTGGAGRWRGGLGLVREWELLAGEAMLTMRADRTKFRPWGLEGGGDGGFSRTVLVDPDGAEGEALPAKFLRRLTAGDRVLHQQAGGGGFGPAFERDPEAVLRDWMDGKVSRAHAESQYGVVIDEASESVDGPRTQQARAQLGALPG